MKFPQGQLEHYNCLTNYNHYNSLTNQLARSFPMSDSINVDQAYPDFCNTISKATTKSILHGFRNIYMPSVNKRFCRFLMKISHAGLPESYYYLRLTRSAKMMVCKVIQNMTFCTSAERLSAK